MKKLMLGLFSAFVLVWGMLCFSPIDSIGQPVPRPGRLIVEEEDGSPSVVPYKLKVTNGVLTDNADGTASLSISGLTASAIVGYTADTAPTSDDLMITVNDPGGTPALRKVTIANLFGNTPIQIFTQQVAPAAAANVAKVWAQDYAAGDTRLYIQSESGNPIVIGKNEFHINNVADTTTNYERGYFRFSGDVLIIGTEKGGSGTARNIQISGPATNNINLTTADNAIVSTFNSHSTKLDGTVGAVYPSATGVDLGYINFPWKNLYVGYGANGQEVKIGTLTELTAVGTGIGYKETTIQIPANCLVKSVSGRVLVQPGGTTTMGVGVSGYPTRYGTAISTVATTTWPGTDDGSRGYSTAVTIRYTFNTNTTDALGSIRSVIVYEQPTAPTS